jgi:hypothetical protein
VVSPQGLSRPICTPSRSWPSIADNRAKLSEEQLREYFLHMVTVKKAARATQTIALCGIKFCFERTLGRTWSTFELVRPPRQRKLPVVLSHEEVCRILACVRIPVYRLCLTTIYAGDNPLIVES